MSSTSSGTPPWSRNVDITHTQAYSPLRLSQTHPFTFQQRGLKLNVEVITGVAGLLVPKLPGSDLRDGKAESASRSWKLPEWLAYRSRRVVHSSLRPSQKSKACLL